MYNKKVLLLFIISLFIITNVNAVDTNSHGIIASGEHGVTDGCNRGFKIYVFTNFSLYGLINYDTTVDPTYAEVKNNSGYVIGNINLSGLTAIFSPSINLVEGNYYYITTGKNCSPSYKEQTYDTTFPINNSLFSWVGGVYENTSHISVDYNLSGFNIESLLIVNNSDFFNDTNLTSSNFGYLTNNISFYYRFDNTSIKDYTGHFFDRVYQNTSFITGVYNNAWNFSGNVTTPSYIDFSTSQQSPISGNLTHSFWINTFDTSADIYTESDCSGGAGKGWYVELANATSLTICNDDGGSPNFVTVTGLNNISNGSWNFVAYTWNETGVSIYLNSVFVKNVTISASTLGTGYGSPTIGATKTTFTRRLNGSLDEMAMWNRVLNSSEISTLYNLGRGFQFPFNLTKFSRYIYDNYTLNGLNNYTMFIVNSGLNLSIGYNDNLTKGDGNISSFHNSSYLYNLSFRKEHYFNKTFLGYNLTSGDLNVSFYQSIINFDCYEKFSDNNLTCVNNTIYPNNGTYNFSVNVSGYYGRVSEENISAFDNRTINIYDFYTSNVSLRSLFAKGLGNNSCTYYVNNLDYGVSEIVYTNYTNTTIGLVNGTYNSSVKCDGHSWSYSNFSVNDSYENITFTIYTPNSFNILFLNEVSKSILNTTTITLGVISDSYGVNYTTTNGTVYIDNLLSNTYLLRYQSLPDYYERTYYVSLLENMTVNLTLYLVNSSTVITINIKDEDDNNVENAFIKILRYDILTNAYIVREIIETNGQGNAYFSGILNTEFYKFIVEYPYGVEKFVTDADYIRSSTITMRISSVDNSFSDYFISVHTYANLYFNNLTNYFTYYYNDPTNSLNGGCLYIYNGGDVYNYSCNSGSSATISLYVNPINGSYYIAQGVISINGVNYLLKTLDYYFNPITSKDTKNNYLFLTMILMVVLSMLFLWNISIALIIVPLPLVLMAIIGLIPITTGVAITIELIAITIVFIISKRS